MKNFSACEKKRKRKRKRKECSPLSLSLSCSFSAAVNHKKKGLPPLYVEDRALGTQEPPLPIPSSLFFFLFLLLSSLHPPVRPFYPANNKDSNLRSQEILITLLLLVYMERRTKRKLSFSVASSTCTRGLPYCLDFPPRP